MGEKCENCFYNYINMFKWTKSRCYKLNFKQVDEYCAEKLAESDFLYEIDWESGYGVDEFYVNKDFCCKYFKVKEVSDG